MYQLNKQATLDVMTGYSLEMRHKINKRWQELEAANDVQFDRWYGGVMIGHKKARTLPGSTWNMELGHGKIGGSNG